MINIHIREHGTHNMGYSFDFSADLDNYSSDTKLLEDLFEYTRTCVIENGLDYDDEMEEWLITDFEFDGDFYMEIDEYYSLSELIKINTALNDMSSTETKLLTILLDEGYKLEEALEKISDGDIYSFEGTLEEWAMEMVDEGLFGEINDKLTFYIDWEKLARDLSYDGYDYYPDFNISVCLN